MRFFSGILSNSLQVEEANATDPKEWLAYEEKCIQEQPPACVTSCPVHVDARALAKEVAAGNFDKALAVFRKSVPFPGIVGRICNHPCETACKRLEAGDAVAIGALERATVEFASASAGKAPHRSSLKKQRIAVVGGGLSGLTAAFDLAQKGYSVTVFEASHRLGGRLWSVAEQTLPHEVVEDELQVLESLGVELQLQRVLGKDITLAQLQADYDAVYLGIGKGAQGSSDSLTGLQKDEEGDLWVRPLTYETSTEGVFAGGGLKERGHLQPSGWPIESVADGRRAAVSIDRYLQKVSLTAVRDGEGSYETKLYTNTSDYEPLSRIVPQERGTDYTREEAIIEAQRCIQCQCMECVKNCEYLAEFGAYPKKYARQINQNLRIVMGIHGANNLINSCSLCGLCKEVCPTDFDMSELIREARNDMVDRGKMPPSAHDFPMEEMAFSNSQACTLSRHQPGHDSSRYVFFPGCQLSASSPQHVERVYDYLRDSLADGVGMMLRCCGISAEWAGRTSEFQEALHVIREEWESLGRPEVILACSTCYQTFKHHLPEIDIVSLWEVYDEYGLPREAIQRVEATGDDNPKVVAVHDSCTTRYESNIHDSVRSLLGKLGFQLEELQNNRERTECCGYGGLMGYANPPLAARVAKRRAEESQADYVTYCAMCRESFTSQGKRAYHILDLMYGDANFSEPVSRGPALAERRNNRVSLQQSLRRNLWGDTVVTEPKEYSGIELLLTPENARLLEERLISTEDVQRVIYYAEQTKDRIMNEETGHMLACYRPTRVTYWVEYSTQDGKYLVHNAYSHRMVVERNK